MNEEIKKLFTTVSKVKIKDGVLFGIKRSTIDNIEDNVLLIFKDGILTQMVYPDQSVFNLPCPFTQNSIFVLLPDKLTTKELAIEFAESAWKEGYNCADSPYQWVNEKTLKTTFISQNKHIL